MQFKKAFCRETKSSPRAEERRARRKLNPKPAYRDQSIDWAHPVADRQTSAEILYKMRWETGSQCRTSRM